MGTKFTTSRGVTVEFVGIATLLDKVNAQHKLPEQPTYEIKVELTGITEKHPLTIDTADTDEQKAVLANYEAEVKRLSSEHNRKLTRLVLLKGIKYDEPTNTDWIAEQNFLGIEIPDNPLERKLHYIETEIIANVADIEAIMLGVLTESGVPEDLVAQARDSFRGPMANKPDAANGNDNQSQAGVELQSTL